MSQPIAFKMQLKPGAVEEYKRRHDNLWPVLAEALHDAGVYDYSIFLDERDLSLIGVLHLTDNNTYADLPFQPVMQRWWQYMADLMQVNADNSPQTWQLPSVFYFPNDLAKAGQPTPDRKAT